MVDLLLTVSDSEETVPGTTFSVNLVEVFKETTMESFTAPVVKAAEES